ncbi:MAG: zinc-dependent alcohol dehydrogenase family protein [Phycisphaerae bacterium]
MQGVLLPGGRKVRMKEFPIPKPGHGQVLLKMKASSICGSDIRAIYREHLGEGPEAYQGVIAGHEPAGQVVEVGPGCKELAEGDRVAVYHISGCGVCDECRHGYMIACRSEHRAAYGWQRDGGHADYMLAEENTCVKLPPSLSYVDGALCACGFGTTYEALTRIGLSGRDRLLITGLGPVGLAAAMLARAMGAAKIIGTDIAPERMELAGQLGLTDVTFNADDGVEPVLEATDGAGCEASIDCSGSAAGRHLALAGTRDWGRCVFVGEGGNVEFDVSQLLIHKQITLYGSWVTSLRHLQDLVERLDRWGIRPEKTVTHRFGLDEAAEAYRTADEGRSGKVCIVMDD